MKETKEMMEILHQNKLKAQKRELVEKKKETKKELLNIVVLVIIGIILTVLLVKAVNNKLNDDFNNCLTEHDANYCEQIGSI